jgi:hypothetical protein
MAFPHAAPRRRARRRPRFGARLLGVAVALGASAAPAPAQVVQPTGGLVVDLHGSVAIYDQPGQVTGPLGVTAESLPARGLGAAGRVHVYPVRVRGIVVGLGASGLWTRGTATPVDREGRPTGPSGETVLASLLPEVSLNFGTRDGWSYLGAGAGWSIYRSRLRAAPETTASPRVRTVSFGAGARWFARPHLAFSFDLRWLALGPQAATADTPARPKTTRLVASAGVSIR